jgi:spore coat polysaccharide biosynthesis protein SpsF (cytidylyltransferase family)
MVTVAQTRFGSTGLPGKVPLPLGRATVLEVLEQQVRQAQFIGSCRR